MCHWWCCLQCVPSESWRETAKNSPTTVGRKANEWRASRTNIQSHMKEMSLQCENSQLERDSAAEAKAENSAWSAWRSSNTTSQKLCAEKMEKKKLPSKCRKMKAKATYQYCNFYKKMAEGLGKELKGNTSYHEKEICVSEKGLKTGGCWGKNWEQADADQDWVQVPAYRSTYSQQRPRNIRGSPVSSISPESKKVMLWMLKDLGSLSSLTQNSVPGHP